MNNRLSFAAVLLLVLLGAGWFIYQGDNTPTPAENTVALPPPAPAQNDWSQIDRSDEAGSFPEPATAKPEDDKTLPPAPVSLDESDTATILAAQELSPELSKSIEGEQQIRKWVSMIDIFADGNLPNKNLPIKFAMKPFIARNSDDGKMYLDAANYARSKPLVDALTSIPPDAMARHYRSWKPLLQQAYAELGKPDTFETRVRQMIFRVVAIQPLADDIELKRPSVYYTFADPTLEKADALSKFIWRMGPENQKRIQDYLRELQPLL
jgi:hypothetical protein